MRNKLLRAVLWGCMAGFLPNGLFAQSLVDSGQSLVGMATGQAAWADYDGDGDLDLVLVGQLADECSPGARVYRNDNTLLVEETGQNLVGVLHGDVAWGDVDSDGDFDLVIVGWDERDEESLRLYLNSGGEAPQLAPDRQSTLEGVRYASLAWGDINRDGDLDLIVIGMDENGVSRTRVYHNTEGVLSEDRDNSEVLVDVHNGDVAWGDVDNDGDLDLVLSGENVGRNGGLGAVTEFYANDPSGTLRLDGELQVETRVKGGGVAWADYDSDGNIDLAISGRDQFWGTTLDLYRNRPTGVLLRDERFEVNAARRLAARLAWADYDNDGDLDLAATGRTILSSYQTFLFQNQDGLLTGLSDEPALAGLAGGDAVWADYNNDGKVDLLIAGVDEAGKGETLLFDNVGAFAANTPPGPVAQLRSARVSGGGFRFSWLPGADAESTLLNYHLRVGTEPGRGDLVSDIAVPGEANAGGRTFYSLEQKLANQTYYWSVQAVDGALARSAWSQEGVVNVQQVIGSNQRLSGLKEGAMAWGDYDGDGYQDMVLMGLNRSSQAQSTLYRNEGDGQLSNDAEVSLVNLHQGDVAWADYNNDGYLDLAISGNDTRDTDENPMGFLYLNNGNRGLEQEFELPAVGNSGLDWGDIDSDGDLDLALIGLAKTTGVSHAWVFANDGPVADGDRHSFSDTEQPLPGVDNGEVAWADYDNDGDLDLALAGTSSDDIGILQVFRNEDGRLSAANSLGGIESADLAWSDYDGDGDLDLVAGGIAQRAGPVLSTVLYRNNGAGDLVDSGVALPGIQGGDLVWGDYDNDGDQDLVILGNNGIEAFTEVHENRDGEYVVDPIQIIEGLDFSAAALVDINLDGDLDLVTAGQSRRESNFEARTLVYDNLEAQFNANPVPQPPVLSSVRPLTEGNRVLLSWGAAVDFAGQGLIDPTPESLSYNLRVGTVPGGGQVLSGVVPWGPGGEGSNLSRRIEGLASGTYYWSVQAVDDGFRRSAWTDSNRSFIIDTVDPVVAGQEGELTEINRRFILNLSQAGIGQTLILNLLFFDLHSGVNLEVEPSVVAQIEGQSFPFTTTQFTGETWSGLLVIDRTMPSGSADIMVRGLLDNKDNELAPFDSLAAFSIDTQEPAVATRFPEPGAVDVAVDLSAVEISFSEPLDLDSRTEEFFQLVSDGASLPLRIEPGTAEDVTVRLVPQQPLMPGTQYGVEVSAGIRDQVGNRPADGINWTFSTQVPGLVARSPEVDAQVGSGDGRISAVFDGGIVASALEAAAAVTVTRQSEGQGLRGAPSFDTASNTLSFEVEGGLRPGSRYEVVLAAALAGPLRGEAFRWGFETLTPDTVDVVPTAAAQGVTELDAPVQVVFDGALDPIALADAGAVSILRQGEGQGLRGAPSFDTATNTLSFAVEGGLRPGSRYEVVLAAALAGPQREEAFRWGFETLTPDLVEMVPAVGAKEVTDLTTPVRIVFDGPLDGVALGAEDGVSILRQGEAQLLRAPPLFDTASNTLSFAVEGDLRPGSRYEVVLAAALAGPLRGEGFRLGFETLVPDTVDVMPAASAEGVAALDAPVRIVFDGPLDGAALGAEDGVSILRQGQVQPLRAAPVFDGASNTLSFEVEGGLRPGSRYEVVLAAALAGPLRGEGFRWGFSTLVPDTAEVIPAAGDTAVVNLSAPVQVVFDGPLDEIALALPNAVVLRQGLALLGLESLDYDRDTRTLSAVPEGGLLPGTPYQIEINPAVGGPLRQAPLRWGFATRVPVVVSTEPADGAQVAAGSQRVEVLFSGPIDPRVVSPLNFVLLRDGLDVRLDAGEFLYDSENFTVRLPAIDFVSGSRYSVAVRPLVSGPRRAGEADLRFSFETALAEVLATQPPDGAEGVSTSTAAIQIVFSGPVARQDAAAFQLRARSLEIDGGAPALVAIGDFGADSTGATIFFTPQQPLAASTEYEVVVDPTVLGARAAEGFSWRFSTAGQVADPAAGGTVTSADRAVELYFPPNALAVSAGEVAIQPLDEDGAARPIAQGDDLVAVGRAFRIEAGAGPLRKAATLTMSYSADEAQGVDQNRLGIFRQEGGAWQRVGGRPDPAARQVRTAVDQLGVFALFEDRQTGVGSTSIGQLEIQPQAFSPAGDRFSVQADISFVLSGPADVTLRVYNPSGRLERVITRDEPMAPGRVLLSWDGRDEDQKIVSSGLYIVVITAGDIREEKIVAVVR